MYRPWEGVPSFIFLDKFIDLWVSQGGCNHEELQNFLKQSYVKLDSNSFDPYKYENCEVSKPTHSNVPTKSDVMEDFQRTCQLKLLRNGLKNLVSKRTTQVELEIQKLSEKEDKTRKLEKEVETRKSRYQRKSECGLRSIIEQS